MLYMSVIVGVFAILMGVLGAVTAWSEWHQSDIEESESVLPSVALANAALCILLGIAVILFGIDAWRNS